jgi:hypothetical protein
MAKNRRNRIQVQLEQHQKNGDAIEIRRNPIDPHPMMAFVVACGPGLALFLDARELEWDGYKIVRIQDITSLDYRGSEKFYERILRGEGIVTDIRMPFKIDLWSWKTAISAIKNQSRSMIIEDENPDDEIFLIGKVTRLSARTVSICHFDAVGHWELSDRVMPYSRITAVTFDCRYIRLYSKYVRKTE